MKLFKLAHVAMICYLFVASSCEKNLQSPASEENTVSSKAVAKTSDSATYVPGQKYSFRVTDPNGEASSFLAIEYIAGDPGSQLILTAPHGGTTRPAYMHTRTDTYSYPTLPADPYNNDMTFSDTPDSKTKELAQEIAAAIQAQTGLRPHVILNYLHRAKLDANRRVEVAAQGDQNAINAWTAFHDFIEDAKTTASANGEVLLLDIHGNAHTPQRTEAGYLLAKNDFTTYYSTLGNLTWKSSIKYMVKPGSVTMTSLIRGNNALGTLMMNHFPFIVTPSKLYPEPGDTSVFTDGKYFDGGYNTARHGSRQGGTVSAIQLEFNQDVRFDDNTRPGYADSIAEAIVEYMNVYF
ncbi:hypothetical protein [Pararcticibacter amylolyticus]|nr:hypothetical protein [Pararcticibacter amylolyticus]